MFSNPHLPELALLLRAHKHKMGVAESCTGGLLGGTITAQAGISDVFIGGFLTYSNEMKQSALGVQAATLQQFGAVSEQTAAEMVVGVLAHSEATLAISITGIAGPDGGTADKPVGLVYIGGQVKGSKAVVEKHIFTGNRYDVRQQAVSAAIQLAISLMH